MLGYYLLILSVLLAGAKIAGEVKIAKHEMKVCVNMSMGDGFTEDEAKAECRR